MSTLTDLARRLRPLIEKAAQSLDDKDASAAPELYGQMKYDGALIKSGTKISWNGEVKKAAVDLWDTEYNNPTNAQALWEDIAYKDGYRLIPAVITAAGAFDLGEVGWWQGEKYKSLLNANVYTPNQYSLGWEKL